LKDKNGVKSITSVSKPLSNKGAIIGPSCLKQKLNKFGFFYQQRKLKYLKSIALRPAS
jgi:hypothetical protein